MDVGTTSLHKLAIREGLVSSTGYALHKKPITDYRLLITEY